MSARPATAKKIEDLHRKIAALVQAEKDYWDIRHPEQNRLHWSISHAQIEGLAESPRLRANMDVATASFPRLPRDSA